MKQVHEKLDSLLDKIINQAFKNKKLVTDTNSNFIVGSHIIHCKNGLYDIKDYKTDTVYYTDLYLLDAALLLSKYTQLKDRVMRKKVEDLEYTYSKHYRDMLFYAESYRYAKEAKDYAKMDTVSFRHDMAKKATANAKQSIKKLSNKIIEKR